MKTYIYLPLMSLAQICAGMDRTLYFQLRRQISRARTFGELKRFKQLVRKHTTRSLTAHNKVVAFKNRIRLNKPLRVAAEEAECNLEKTRQSNELYELIDTRKETLLQQCSQQQPKPKKAVRRPFFTFSNLFPKAIFQSLWQRSKLFIKIPKRLMRIWRFKNRFISGLI